MTEKEARGKQDTSWEWWADSEEQDPIGGCGWNRREEAHYLH
jgi:phage gp46-like protein